MALVVSLWGNRNLHLNQAGILLPQGNPSAPNLQQHRAAVRIPQALDVCSGDKTEVLQPPLHCRCGVQGVLGASGASSQALQRNGILAAFFH